MREESDMSSREPHRRRPTACALIVATGLILTSCTSGSAGVHLQTADPPSSTAADLTSSTVDTSTISPPQPVASSTPSPVSSSKTTPVTITPATTPAKATTTANPWPANFTGPSRRMPRAHLLHLTGLSVLPRRLRSSPARTGRRRSGSMQLIRLPRRRWMTSSPWQPRRCMPP